MIPNLSTKLTRLKIATRQRTAIENTQRHDDLFAIYYDTTCSQYERDIAAEELILTAFLFTISKFYTAVQCALQRDTTSENVLPEAQSELLLRLTELLHVYDKSKNSSFFAFAAIHVNQLVPLTIKTLQPFALTRHLSSVLRQLCLSVSNDIYITDESFSKLCQLSADQIRKTASCTLTTACAAQRYLSSLSADKEQRFWEIEDIPY